MRKVLKHCWLYILRKYFFDLISVWMTRITPVKGQLISNANCQSLNSSKNQTNEFVFTSMRRVFVRFLEEIEDSTETFWNYLTFNWVFRKGIVSKRNASGSKPTIKDFFNEIEQPLHFYWLASALGHFCGFLNKL